jgi:hypothetical protein
MRSSKPMCFVPSTFRLGSERDQGCLRWPEDGGLDASGQPGTLLGPSRATDTDDGDDHQSHQDHGFLPRHHARGDERVSGIATGSSRKAHADVRGTRSLRRDGRPPMRLGRSAADGDVEVGHDNHEGNRQGAHEHDEAEPTSHVRRLPGAGRRPDGAHGNNRNYFAQIPLLKSRCSNELLKRVAQTSCSNELLKRGLPFELPDGQPSPSARVMRVRGAPTQPRRSRSRSGRPATPAATSRRAAR